MRVSELSKRYALAHFQSAKEVGKADMALSELRVLSEALTSTSEIFQFVATPLVAADQKRSIMKGALEGKFSEASCAFIYLLAEKGRLGLLPEITMAYESIIDAENGVTRGEVRSAAPLSAEAIKSLEQTINQVVNKRVILKFQEDPSLLGGLVAQVGGWTFDDSLDLHLKKMNEELNRRIN